MAYEVTDELREHYDALRKQRGWSWETLAESFEAQTVDPTSENLSRWARAQGAADKSERAAKRGTERATEAAPEKRG